MLLMNIENYYVPSSIAAAVQSLVQGEATILAGGTDLTPQTASGAKEFAATDPDKRHLVFAPARFVSQKMLAEQNIPVEFVPLPFALYRIDRS